jgi:hypothetical protein
MAKTFLLVITLEPKDRPTFVAEKDSVPYSAPYSAPVGQLNESHGQELIRTGQRPASSIPVVAVHAAPKLLRVNLLHHLRKGGLGRVHVARYHPGFESPTRFSENQINHTLSKRQLIEK